MLHSAAKTTRVACYKKQQYKKQRCLFHYCIRCYSFQPRKGVLPMPHIRFSCLRFFVLRYCMVAKVLHWITALATRVWNIRLGYQSGSLSLHSTLLLPLVVVLPLCRVCHSKPILWRGMLKQKILVICLLKVIFRKQNDLGRSNLRIFDKLLLNSTRKKFLCLQTFCKAILK